MKRRKIATATAVSVVAALAVLAASVQADSGRDERNDDDRRHDDGGAAFDSRIRQGYAIAPVPLELHGRNRALVGLGSYIVNAQGGCNDCHTAPPYAPGGNPFEGQPAVVNAAVYLAGGAPFGPNLVSANITPDEHGRPAGLTREEFVTLLRTGRDHEDPDRILQVMPWPVFGQMTERDLRAVYEYLRTIPSLPDNF